MLFPFAGSDYRKKIEWWFFQGYFDSVEQEASRSHFMACLFRTSAKDRSGQHGHSLIVSELQDTWKGPHGYNSSVDQHVINIFIDSKTEIETNLSSHLVNAYCDELAACGPPAPIALASTSPTFLEKERTIVWDSFQLRQQKNELELRLNLPSSKNCQFTLAPGSPSYAFEYRKPGASGSSSWITTPRLELRGTQNGRACRGQAWYDYQRSNYGFFHADEDNSSVYGWDWLGISLDRDTHLIVYVFRDLRDRKVISTDAYLMMQDGSSRHIRDLSLHHLGHWQSNTTHIFYPSLLRLEIPEIQLNLDISPMVQDQEIPILGVIRAIWEGVATFTGTFRETEVNGYARVEYHGYGYIFDTQSYLSGFTERIDLQIEEFLPRILTEKWLDTTTGAAHWQHDPESITASLAKPVWDLLDRNGKHWRPICAMLFLESLGVASEPYSQLISAVSELNHTGSLIIDDIEDSSPIRRGQEAIHLRYGVDTAINAGNTLYFLPYLLLRDHPGFTDNQRLMAYKLMVEMLCRCHMGQGLDIHWSKNLSPESLDDWLTRCFDKKILQMYAFKTGAQIEGVAEMACIIAEAPADVRQAYAALGRNFGVAFQIIDDIHNFSSSKGWTKKRGEDISSAKPTYVIIKALQMLDRKSKERFIDILCAEKLRSDPDCLDEAVELVVASGALQYCRNEAEELFRSSWDSFAKVACHNDAKIMLKMFFLSILNYSYDV